ncbi:MAG: galactose mutarotase [Rhizobiaceae bacterium]|nr:galactose mutarotase [Rhizobiaceae bacterium]
MSGPEIWGRTADGADVLKLRIEDGGLTADILTWGAAVQDLRLDGHPHPLVLGFKRFDDYPAHSPYFGATAGRVANRIREGRFTIDGVTHQAERNLDGRHTLHSGKQGIGKRNWRLVDFGADFARLEIVDPDGFAGFPGTVTITNEYRLEDDALKVSVQARTDAPTIVNIAHHSYFNLEDGGATDCLGHRLKIAAEAITELDGDLVASGALNTVAGTPYDFRDFAPIRRDGPGGPFAHDINYCVSAARMALRPVAWARAPRSGVSMEVLTTEPGMQLYTGSKIGGRPADGLIGRPYDAFAGFCFEAQCWPDAPNHPHFPSILLRPGETYAQETWYRFEKA